MRIKFLATIFLLSLLALTLNFCDAPRSNPLDPASPNNILAIISGKIESVSLPREPIPEVRVFWRGSSAITETDANGEFLIEDIAKNNDWLFFEKEGYTADSIFIDWQGDSQKNVSLFLNAAPQLLDKGVVSRVLNNYPDRQDYFIEFKAQIFDQENDVDSVYIRNSDLNIDINLVFNFSTGLYEDSFRDSELFLNTIDEAVGKDFDFVVSDKEGRVYNVGSTNLKRIIRQEILFDTPFDNDTVSVPYTLRWKRYLPGFSFNYKLQIYTSEITPELVWEKTNISSEEIEYNVAEFNFTGSFFWVIWCTDEFGNTARSKPATFFVE